MINSEKVENYSEVKDFYSEAENFDFKLKKTFWMGSKNLFLLKKIHLFIFLSLFFLFSGLQNYL